MTAEHKRPPEGLTGAPAETGVQVGFNAPVTERTMATPVFTSPEVTTPDVPKPVINLGYDGIDRGLVQLPIDRSEVGTRHATVIDALVEQHFGDIPFVDREERPGFLEERAKPAIERKRTWTPYMEMGLAQFSRGRDSGAFEVIKPEKRWIAGVYGMKVVPDTRRQELVRLEEAGLRDVQRIQQAIAGSILAGEHTRVAMFVDPPYPGQVANHPANNDLWLEVIRDGGIPIMRGSEVEKQRDGDYDYYRHDYDVHLGTMALFPKEVQDMITETATFDLIRRHDPHGGVTDDITETFKNDGIRLIDDITDEKRYFDLLSFLVKGEEPCAERMERILDDSIAGDYTNIEYDHREDVNTFKKHIAKMTRFNTYHREARAATEEEIEDANRGFITGIVRVAEKIRGTYEPEAESDQSEETIPMQTLGLSLQEQSHVLFTDRFGKMRWVNPEDPKTREEFFSTQPDLSSAMMLRGPQALQEHLDNGGSGNVTVLYPDDPEGNSFFMSRFTTDPEQGLLTFYAPFAVEVQSGGDITQTLPIASAKATLPEFFRLRIEEGTVEDDIAKFEEFPQIKEFIAALGYKTREDNSLTMPMPQEFQRRMDIFREGNPWGFYIPQVQLVDAGHIDAKDYLASYAQSIYPVSTEDFYYYNHDAASVHMIAFMIHGEPLMDMISQYAKANADADAKQLAVAEHTIDEITGALGDYSFDAQLGSDIQYQSFEQVLHVLRSADTLKDLQIVQSMLQTGQIEHEDEIDGYMLRDALVEEAQARFGRNDDK